MEAVLLWSYSHVPVNGSMFTIHFPYKEASHGSFNAGSFNASKAPCFATQNTH